MFLRSFELEDWPIIHHDYSSKMVAYNGSKFNLRGRYKDVFHEIVKNDEQTSSSQRKKYFKIKYTINALPSIMYSHGKCVGVS